MSKLYKLKALVLTALLITTGSLFGQNNNLYDWQADRTWTEGIATEGESLILVKNHVQYDYDYDESGGLIVYLTYHKIYRVNNDEAVQRVNRIYIPLNDAIDIVNVKARTISQEGKVVELDKSNIKEVKDDEAGPGYRIFAIEGAEVGGEIEYFYTKKAQASVFGREYFQYGYPVLSSSFRLTSPGNLLFEFKGYNGMPEVKQDEGELIKNAHEVTVENIDPLREEQFGSYNANRQRIEFKLSYNKAAGDQRLFTWNDAAKRISSLIYPFASTEKTAIEDLIKELKLKRYKSPMEQFAAFEHHVKSNFYIDDQAQGGADRIDFILANKYSTERGFTRLFAALAEVLEIPHEVVLTSDRTNTRFDGEFESWNYLSDYLIYFPVTDQYMAPYRFENRLGLWPAEFSATAGLFIKSEVFEGTAVAKGEVKEIPELPYENNLHRLRVNVAFNEDLSSNKVIFSRSSNGYEGSFIKFAYSRANEQQREEFLEDLLGFIGPNEEFYDKSFTGDIDDFQNWADYLTYKGSFDSENFIEQAGDIILFKAGELIGGQSELYQENERQNIIENDYNRGYDREIEVTIPEGYTIQNPQDIDLDVEAEDNDRVVYLFKSTHEIKGNKLLIKIIEYYDQVYFPKERFEEYRKVINAAADWNKVVLVMQPN